MLLAGTGTGIEVVDGGVSRSLEGSDVRCLASEGDVVFAGTQGDGVWRSDDRGRSWREAGLQGSVVKALACAGGTVYAGTKPPRVWRSDGGGTWEPLAPFSRLRSWWWRQPAERPSTPYVSALALADEGTIVAGIEACGVVRSDDGGRSWSGHRPGALRDCHGLAAHDGHLYEVGCCGGFALSRNGGATWERHRVEDRYGWSVAADPVEPGVVYVSAAPMRKAHTRDARASVYRFDAGEWERVLGPVAALPRLAHDGRSVYAAVGTRLYADFEALPVELGEPARALLAL